MNCKHFGNWFSLHTRISVIDYKFSSFSDNKHIERSQNRLNIIHEMEQRAAYQSQRDKNVSYRISELKGSEIQFKANLEQRKSLNEMESTMKRLNITK